MEQVLRTLIKLFLPGEPSIKLGVTGGFIRKGIIPMEGLCSVGVD